MNKDNFKTIFFPLKKVLPSIRYVGATHFPPGGKYQNVHNALEICYIDSGGGRFLQGKNIRFNFRKGNIFLIKPKRKFVVQTNSGEQLRAYYLGIDFTKVKKKISLITEETELLVLQKIIYSQDYKMPLQDKLNIGLLLKKLYKEIIEKRASYLILAKGYCLECLSLLVRLIQDEEIKKDNKPSSRNYKIVEKAIKFIEKNYQQKLYLTSLASNVYLSPYHFSRIFKAHTGYSPIRYLNMHRIENAKELLADENLTFSDIAIRTGFNDPFYFSAIFKKIEGFSPLQYKKLLREIHIPAPLIRSKSSKI